MTNTYIGKLPPGSPDNPDDNTCVQLYISITRSDLNFNDVEILQPMNTVSVNQIQNQIDDLTEQQNVVKSVIATAQAAYVPTEES